MCGSMVGMQCATAEIRGGKKKEEETTGQKYNVLPYSIGDHNKSSAVAEMGDGLAT